MDILVNTAKKLIYTEPMKALLIQGESLVDSIVFKLPATYGDVSLADLAFSISMTNDESEVTVTSVLTKTVGESGVDAAWSVTKSHTAVAGSFKLTLSCVDETGDVILKLVGEYAVNVRKDPSAQGFGMIADTLYEQLLAQINYAISHIQIVKILGTYATLTALEEAITSPSIGDMYNVGSAAPYTVYVWQGEWVSLGLLQGPTGLPGADGTDGTDGTNGTDGADGVGVPAGGAANTYLRKKSATDYDTEFGVILPAHIGTYGVPPLDASGRIPASTATMEKNSQSGNYTIQLSDYGKDVQSSGASAQAFTLPNSVTASIPVGWFCFVSQIGAGELSLVAGSGVTIQSPGGRLKVAEQYVQLEIVLDAENVYRIIGSTKT